MTVVVAVVPALDEEGAIADVVRGIMPHVAHVVVVDNGSRDRTREVAPIRYARRCTFVRVVSLGHLRSSW